MKSQDVHRRHQSRFKLFQSQLVVAQRSTWGRSSREFEWLPFHGGVSPDGLESSGSKGGLRRQSGRYSAYGGLVNGIVANHSECKPI
jgi:hypothetical protein